MKRKKINTRIAKKILPTQNVKKIIDNPPLGTEINKPTIGIKGTTADYNKTADRMADNLVRLPPFLTELDLVEPSNLGNNEKNKMYQAPMQDPNDFVLHEPGSGPNNPDENYFLSRIKSFMGWAAERAQTKARNARDALYEKIKSGLKSGGKWVGRKTGRQMQKYGGKLIDFSEGDACKYCEEICGTNKQNDGTFNTLKQIADDAEKAIK